MPRGFLSDRLHNFNVEVVVALLLDEAKLKLWRG